MFVQSGYRAMITFNVVKETHGWAIRMGERMTTPFWSRELAIREAYCLADAIGFHGECTEVIVEGADPAVQPRKWSLALLETPPRAAGRARSDQRPAQ